MKQKNNTSINWRDPACYDYTNHFNRQDWAWEYLRANPKYRNEYYQLKEDCVDMKTEKSGIGNITVYHQKPSDLKAGEWGLLNFR